MSRTTSGWLAGLVTLSLGAGTAFAGGAPNQGDPSKVITVDNPKVWCKYPQPGPKIEGGLGRVISFSAYAPIDFVTVKSGSNYVVWTCPKKY